MFGIMTGSFFYIFFVMIFENGVRFEPYHRLWLADFPDFIVVVAKWMMSSCRKLPLLSSEVLKHQIRAVIISEIISGNK
jgi:hypothetical protein